MSKIEPVAWAYKYAFEQAMAAGKGCDVWPVVTAAAFIDVPLVRFITLEQHEQAVAEATAALQKRVDAREHDFPLLQQFHSKHALGPMLPPSCIVCGQQTHPYSKPVAVQHMELPGIVVCKQCKEASEQLAAQAAEIAELKAERDTFYMDYRVKTDGELKAKDAEIASHIRAFEIAQSTIVMLNKSNAELIKEIAELKDELEDVKAERDEAVARSGE